MESGDGFCKMKSHYLGLWDSLGRMFIVIVVLVYLKEQGVHISLWNELIIGFAMILWSTIPFIYHFVEEWKYIKTEKINET